MDDHCRSCHGLSFDVFDPDIELPHGEVRAAVTAMEAHFIREFTDPVLRAERAQEKPRRVPGKRTAAIVCEGSGLDCGRAEAMKEAAYQFTESGCITCHEVTDSGLANIMTGFACIPQKSLWTGIRNHGSYTVRTGMEAPILTKRASAAMRPCPPRSPPTCSFPIRTIVWSAMTNPAMASRQNAQHAMGFIETLAPPLNVRLTSPHHSNALSGGG